MPSMPKLENNSTPAAKDHYDRANQGRDIMHSVSSTGDLPDHTMAILLAACTVVDSLLAIADAVYATKSLQRDTKE